MQTTYQIQCNIASFFVLCFFGGGIEEYSLFMKRMSHKAFQLIRYAPPPAPRILGVCCKDGVIRQWRSGKKIPSFFFLRDLCFLLGA